MKALAVGVVLMAAGILAGCGTTTSQPPTTTSTTTTAASHEPSPPTTTTAKSKPSVSRSNAKTTSSVALSSANLNHSSPTILDPEGGGPTITDVSCASAELCVATDYSGTLWTSSQPLGGPISWNAVKFPTYPDFSSIACPSVRLCVVITNGGDIYTSSDPLGGQTTNWIEAAIDGSNSLQGLACPTVGLCLAVDSAGNLLESTNPAGGAATWRKTAFASSSELPLSVACASSKSCLVTEADGDVLSTATPSGPLASWTTHRPTGLSGTLFTAFCPLTTTCFIENLLKSNQTQILESTDPFSPDPLWNALSGFATGAVGLGGISCPSPTLCVAVSGGDVFFSHGSPANPKSSWTTSNFDSHMQIAVTAIATAANSLASVARRYPFALPWI